MSDSGKDIIYIDIDDEITSIVGKIKASKHKVVALVLPKRANMLQSTVNMRLLKRSATQANKSIVLITSETGLLPLAGAVGLHVAKTLSSKPTIPPLPRVDDQPEVIDAELLDSADAVDKTKSIGELAGLPASQEPDEVIEVDGSELAAATAEEEGETPKTAKKLKVPNFERFRLKLALGILAGLVLLLGWLWAFVIAPRAVVTIKTDTTTQSSTIDFTGKVGSETPDIGAKVVAAKSQSTKKSDSEKVAATGEKNNGKTATGSVTMTATECSLDLPGDVPAGTTLNHSGLGYTTDEATKFSASGVNNGNGCITYSATDSTAITASKSGTKYNAASGSKFSVSGRSDVSASGSASGGTDDIIKVVSASDVNAAKQKIAQRAGDATKELRAALEKAGFISLSDTLENNQSTVTAEPKVGEEATQTTVTVTTTYTMAGLKEADLERLVEADVNKQIDPSKQAMLDAGLKDAVFRVIDKRTPSRLKVNIQTIATVGAKLDQEALKRQIIGLKRGDAEALIASQPGVKEVKIDYSPFWIYSTPKSTKKITIVIEETEKPKNPDTNGQQP